MSERPPFDAVRFACLLIAAALALEALVVLLGIGVCLWHAELIMREPDIVCDPKDRLLVIMRDLVASGFALLAIFRPPTKP